MNGHHHSSESQRVRLTVEEQEAGTGVVLTDADAPTLPKNAPCPSCEAPAKQRIQSNGFGSTFNEICGACGFKFGQGRRS
jgi:hypothetical protein